MKKDDIQITDLYRILHGEVPLEFYAELFIRALFVFLVLTFGMKYLGKRASSQLSRSELAATATLAAATGLVILAPDRGLVPPLIIVGILIFIQRFVHKRSMKSESFETAAEGHLSVLIDEGVLDLEAMKKARISRDQLFSELRGSGILHLGQVKRIYLEANGKFTVIKRARAGAGLPVIPDWDQELLDEQDYASFMVCTQCGDRIQPESICEKCGCKESQGAVRD